MAISSNTSGMRPGVCTSTSRPSSPYEGQMIYETDTDRMYTWNGSTWVIGLTGGSFTISTSLPSGGIDGDLWMVYS